MADSLEKAERKFKKLLIDTKKPLCESIDKKDEEVLANDLIESFRLVLNLYTKKNEWTKFFELVDSFEHSLNETAPANQSRYHMDELLRLIGDIFYAVDLKPTAFEYYKKSIRLSNDSNLVAMESCENLVDEAMERWHYRMINDAVRNRAFSMAIFKRLNMLRQQVQSSREIRVLDIGSGTGLLSALCLANSLNFGNSNIKIYACEENKFFYDICRKFIKSIDDSNRVKVINKNSNDLDLKDDLDGQKIDLIITEIFDDGLLGEGCLYTIYNALFVQKLVRTRFESASACSSLLSSHLITQSARIFICAVESFRLRCSSRFRAAGFTGKFERVSARCLNNSERFETEFDTSELNFEPYTSENLNYLDDLEILSQPEEIDEFRIGFANEKLLEKLCKYHQTIKTKKHLKITHSGILDAFVLWFELYLDDDIVLSNCPQMLKKSKNVQLCQCWDQAVYNVSKEVTVSEDQLIGVDCRLRSDCLMVNLSEKKNSLEQDDQKELVLWLSEFEIRLLNNHAYQDFFAYWFEAEIGRLSDSDLNGSLTIGLLSNTFSQIFFNLVLKYEPMLKLRNIQLKLEVFVNLDLEFASYFTSVIDEHFPNVKTHFLNQLTTEQKYNLDYLIFEPIDAKFGVLKKHLFSELVLIKSCNTNQNLKIYPDNIKLKATLIESDALLKDCQLVTNKNLCIDSFKAEQNIDLDSHMSDYYTPQQYSLNINHKAANYKQMTEIVTILELDNLDKVEYQVENCALKVVQSGRVDLVLYWYELSGSGFHYSPVKTANLDHPDTFWSQIIGFSVYGKSKQIDPNKHLCVNLNFLFKNQMFFIKSLTLS